MFISCYQVTLHKTTDYRTLLNTQETCNVKLMCRVRVVLVLKLAKIKRSVAYITRSNPPRADENALASEY